MDTNINRLNEEMKAEGLGEGISELGEVLDANTEKISEVVGKVGENKATQVTAKKVTVKTASLFEKISDLLFTAKAKEIVLPSQKIQRKRVEYSLGKKTKKLLRQARKIQNARHFSAYALEQVVQEIRYLQRLMAELFAMAAQKLETLYKQYVLRVA